MRCSSAAVVAAFVAGSSLFGCSSNPGTVVTPAPTATAIAQVDPATRIDFSTRTWRAYDSLSQGFSMPLPEDLEWRVEDVKDAWLVAKHAPTKTEIVARMLATDGLANRARCEGHARELRALPVRDDAIVIEKKRVDLPSGFDTVVEVGILATKPGKPITGYVLAFGGWAKKCFAYALTTSAMGRGAEEAVGDRLALFVERSFLKMRFASDLSPVVPREKPPI